MGRLTHFGFSNHGRGTRARLRAAVPSDGVLWRAFLVAALLLGLLVAAGGVNAQSGRTEITGQVDVIHIDYFEPGRSEFQYFIEDEATGERTRLRFPRGAPAGLRSGDVLTVRGSMRDGRLDVEQSATAPAEADAAADAAAAIERKTLVIMVDMTDAAATDFYTIGQVTGQMYTGTRNVDGLYRTSSHGQLGFSPVNTDGTNDVIGPVAIDASGTTCDYYDWAEKADAAADALPGIDLSQYDHRVYILPRYNALGTTDDICGWAGVANVGCNRSDRYSPAFCRSWIAEGESGMVYAHELGHNLYMAHASIDPDNDGVIENTTNGVYGDYSDPMGLSRAWHVFNAAHTHQMNWFDADNTIFDVQAGGVYALYPMERDGASVPGTRALRIRRDNTGDYYYLSWRQALGTYDGVSTTYTRGLNVHRYLAGYYNTRFITSLSDGGRFDDTANNLSITQLGVNGSGALEIEIAFGCAPVDPSVTFSPSYAANDGTGSVAYTVSLTNNDSAVCDPRSFAVDETNFSLYADTTGSLGAGATWNGGFTVAAGDVNNAEGANMLRVQADMGDGPATDTATFFLDTTNPGVPGNVAVSINKKGNGSVTWTAASDGAGSGIDYYVVLKNGTVDGTAAGTSYSISGAASGDEFAVKSVDRVGHQSAEVVAAEAVKGGGKGGGGKDGGGGGKPCNPKKDQCG